MFSQKIKFRSPEHNNKVMEWDVEDRVFALFCHLIENHGGEIIETEYVVMEG